MIMHNREYVGKAFELLSEGLTDPVDAVMTKVFHSPDWTAVWARIDQEKYGTPPRTMSKHDVQVQLRAITEYGRDFNGILSRAQQAYASELRETRNRWAHMASFTVDETDRALNTIELLLDVVSAPDSADDVRRLRHALRHTKSNEPETADATQSAIAPHGPANAAIPHAIPHNYDRQADVFFKTLLENIYTARASVTNFMSQVSKHRKDPDEADKATALASELAQLKSSREYRDALKALFELDDTTYGFLSQHNMKGYYVHVGNLNIEPDYRDIYHTGLHITLATHYFDPISRPEDLATLRAIANLRAKQSPEITEIKGWNSLQDDFDSGKLSKNPIPYYRTLFPAVYPDELGLYSADPQNGYARRKLLWETFWSVTTLMPR